MASLKTKFSVGLFLIIGMVVVIVGVIWLGMSNYLDQGRFYVAYFDESVQGLDKDSPVKYRGVAIGRVHAIGVAPDERLIQVVMQIDPDLRPKQSSTDIVAQLKSVGITGLMFIELERRSNGEADVSPKIDFEPPFTVIATRPSEISKIFKGIEDIFALFRSLDTAVNNQLGGVLKKVNQAVEEARLPELMRDIRATVKNLHALVKPEKVDRLLSSMTETSQNWNRTALNADGGIDEIRDTVADLDRVINHTGNDAAVITAELKNAAAQVKQAMEAAVHLLENTDHQVDSLQRQTVVTLQRVELAGQNLTRLLERLSNQPSQLIFSAPAEEKPAAP